MAVPNAVAARYFQASGLPLVDTRNLNLNAMDPAGAGTLAANPSPTPQPGARSPLRPAPALANRPARPPVVGTPNRALPAGRGLARVGPY